MKLRIKTATLRDVVGKVQGVAERKSTIPILSNCLIDAGDGQVRVTATDLDVTVKAKASADVERQGSIALPAQKLFDIARFANADEIVLSADGNDKAEVSAGRAKFKIGGHSADQFPDTPTSGADGIDIDGTSFGNAVRLTSFAITTEQSRFTLSGAKVEIGNGIFRMVATDGHRLAIAEFPSEGEADVLIPRKGLTEAAKLFADTFRFSVTDTAVRFESANTILTARKLTGTFPNYAMVLPKNPDKSVTFDAGECLSVLKRVGVLADDRTNKGELTVAPDSIRISARNGDGNAAEDEIPAQSVGVSGEVGVSFNLDYLADVLNAATGEVTARFTDGQTQWLFESNRDWRCVIMPMR